MKSKGKHSPKPRKVSASLDSSTWTPRRFCGPSTWLRDICGPPDRPARVCALPGCEKTSSKRYCCVEHCREHREMDKARREARKGTAKEPGMAL